MNFDDAIFHQLKQMADDIQKPSLHTDGYEIIHNALILDERDVEKVQNYAQKRATCIFNHNSLLDRKQDYKRKQAFLPRRCAPKLQEQIHSILREKYPYLYPKDMAVLHSKPGCQQQNPHCDYEFENQDFTGLKNFHIPLGCVISIMANTRLEVWPRSMCVSSRQLCNETFLRKTLFLEAGDIVVFRGDLTHAGSAYQEDNYRLHTYLDSPDVMRSHNKTWSMHTCKSIQM